MDYLLAGGISLVARGTLLRGLSLGTGLVLALPASALLVRSLGVDGYGALSFASSVAGLAAIVSDLGLGVGISRMSTHQELRSGSFARLGLMTGLGTGFLASIAVLWVAMRFEGAARLALLISAPMALFGGVRSILSGALAAKGRVLLLEGTLAAQNFLYYGVSIFLAAVGAATVGRIATVQTVAFGIGVLAIMPAWLIAFRRAEQASIRLWRQLAGFSVPLLLSGISGIVLQRSDVILLGILRGQTAVGRYSPVLKLVDVANVALIALGSYYVPVTTRLVARGELAHLRSIYVVVTKWAIVLSAPLLVTLVVQPAPLLAALFGRPFLGAGRIAAALAAGYALNILAGLNGLTLVALGKSRQIGLRSVLTLVVNLGLNALLIPHLGALGAAIGTATAYAALNVANSSLIYRAARVHPFRADFFSVLGAVVAAGLTGYGVVTALGLRHSVWGSVTVLVITALFGVVAAGLTATPTERSLLRELCGRLTRSSTSGTPAGSAGGE